MKYILTLLLSITCAGSAIAADVNPAAYDPANTINTIDDTLPAKKRTTAPSGLEIGSEKPDIQAPKGNETKITLQKVEIIGSKSELPQNVAEIYQKNIGKEVTITDISNIANEMESTYRNNGNMLVQIIIPPQKIEAKKGVIKFQVIEGYISNVQFNGEDPGAARKQLEIYANQIKSEGMVTYKTLDRFLNLANNLPGIDVSATLVPDEKATGGANLVIDVKKKSYSAFINTNNRGTKYVGRHQASAGGAVYNILGADYLSVAGATVLDDVDNLQYGKVSYGFITGRYGTEINPSYTYAANEPGGALSALELQGKSSIYNLAINQPLIVSSQQNVTLETAFRHTNSYNDSLGSRLYHDKITALSLGLDYQGEFLSTYNNIDLSATAGLPLFGADSDKNTPSIANGDAEFIKFNLSTSSMRYFTQKLSLALETQFQITPDAMLASEQAGYGGQNFGKGFSPYIISGDNSYMGSFAVRYDLPTFNGVSLIQPQVFYDIGRVTLNDAAPGTPDDYTGQSAGIGVLVQTEKNWELSLTLAKPLELTNTTKADMGWDGFFSITGRF